VDRARSGGAPWRRRGALVLAWRTRPEAPPPAFLRALFATLALPYLAGPLGFPWYLTWCLPFAVVARNRAWLVLAALASAYYLRFWCDYNPARAGFASSAAAVDFFDRVVVTAELGLFLIVYAWDGLRRRAWI
jgi:hypothetical protein